MSANPRPKTDPELPPAAPPGSDDADGWALLEALRRRLDDQAAQGRKTQVQVSQLADSIAALVAEQRRRSKWLNLNSFVAYVIFTVVVGAGFFALYRSRANELVEARDAARHERDLAAQRAGEASGKLAARDKADALAWDVYELLEAGKRVEATDKLAALGEQPLSRTERAVLAARAHETKVMEVDAALKAAAAAFKAGRYGDVIAPLDAALVGEPAGARAGAMHYFLGVARAKSNDLAKAVAHLQLAVASDTAHDDARFQLASALDRSGQYAKARAEYDQFATAYPQSHLAVFAMRRSATLARMPATAAPKPAPATIAPSPGSATAPPAAKPAAPPAPAPSAPKPIVRPPVKPAVTPSGKPPAGPAPAPAPPADGEGSAAVTPMSTMPVELRESMSTAAVERRRERDRAPAELPPAAPVDAPALPVAPIDRPPPPTEAPPVERAPAPAPAQPPRVEVPDGHAIRPMIAPLL